MTPSTGKMATIWAAVLAVGLWIVGLIFLTAVPTNLSDTATDDQILAWVRGNANDILLGGWLFVVGCLAFIWFAGQVRARLIAAEGQPGTMSTIAFAGAVATAIFGIANPAGDMDAAINKNDISAATAGTLHHLSDAFFVASELALILFLVATAVVAFRTAVLPKWWAIVSVVVAVVLAVGPIGWAALIFGLPLWTLGTSVLLARAPRTAVRREAAPAV